MKIVAENGQWHKKMSAGNTQRPATNSSVVVGRSSAIDCHSQVLAEVQVQASEEMDDFRYSYWLLRRDYRSECIPDTCVCYPRPGILGALPSNLLYL